MPDAKVTILTPGMDLKVVRERICGKSPQLIARENAIRLEDVKTILKRNVEIMQVFRQQVSSGAIEIARIAVAELLRRDVSKVKTRDLVDMVKEMVQAANHAENKDMQVLIIDKTIPTSKEDLLRFILDEKKSTAVDATIKDTPAIEDKK